MARPAQDKTPQEIRFLLNQRGLTFADLDRLHGFKSGTARGTTRYPHLEGERAIAKVLDLNPIQLWPSRFNPKTGARLKPQPSANYRDRPRMRTGLKQEAA